MAWPALENSRIDSLKLIEEAIMASRRERPSECWPSENKLMEENHERIEVVTFNDRSPSQFWHGRRYSVSRMPKIATYIREKCDSEDYYPLVVSLGPYHHGHPSLQSGEELKPRAVKIFASESGEKEELWLDVVRRVTGDLRKSYIEGSTDKYDDDEFARMMLQDACLALLIMAEVAEEVEGSLFKLLGEHLGMGAFLPLTRDLLVFENQLPFWFLESMLCFRYGQDAGVEIVRKFLAKVSLVQPVDFEPNNICNNGQFQVDAPTHLLEALKRLVIGELAISSGPSILSRLSSIVIMKQVWTTARKISHYGVRLFGGMSRDTEELLIDSFNSITELKAKGIHIRSSTRASCNGIKFQSSYFHGTLQLPAFYATILTKPLYSNIIVYEMSPGSGGAVIVTAYVSFLKSIIQSPKDVKELRNNGILTSKMGGDEEVMKLFNSINTFGIDSSLAYGNVRAQIQKHYNSQTKTWVAECLHSYFRTPWTVIALIISFLLVCLTFIQTYFTIYPKGRD